MRKAIGYSPAPYIRSPKLVNVPCSPSYETQIQGIGEDSIQKMAIYHTGTSRLREAVRREAK